MWPGRGPPAKTDQLSATTESRTAPKRESTAGASARFHVNAVAEKTTGARIFKKGTEIVKETEIVRVTFYADAKTVVNLMGTGNLVQPIIVVTNHAKTIIPRGLRTQTANSGSALAGVTIGIFGIVV